VGIRKKARRGSRLRTDFAEWGAKHTVPNTAAMEFNWLTFNGVAARYEAAVRDGTGWVRI